MKSIVTRFKKDPLGFTKLKKDPLGFIKRVLFKTIIGPIKYGKGNDYDAKRYWHDRFSKYGLSLKGAGDEGLSDKENKRMYTEAMEVFIDVCRKEHIDFQNIRVLEIGCGNGFYTQIFQNLGVKKYLGIDITDVLFPELTKKFPEYTFVRKDITVDNIEGTFDLIVMIDVIEHIVNDSKLSFAMENIKNCLSNNGVFIIAPVAETSRKHLFYVRLWSLEDIRQRFQGYILGQFLPFRKSYILTVRKQ